MRPQTHCKKTKRDKKLISYEMQCFEIIQHLFIFLLHACLDILLISRLKGYLNIHELVIAMLTK